jgi:hypothetical protein
MKTKKRNPQDLTSRNNDARKKEITALKKRVKELEELAKYSIARFEVIEREYVKMTEYIERLYRHKSL